MNELYFENLSFTSFDAPAHTLSLTANYVISEKINRGVSRENQLSGAKGGRDFLASKYHILIKSLPDGSSVAIDTSVSYRTVYRIFFC